MTPILYSKTEQDFTSLGLGMLNDALSCIVKTVLNGTFELEMTYPVKGRRYADIQVGCIIKAVAEKYGSAQLFDVYGITKPLNGIITVYATHVTGRKSYIPIMPCTATSCAEVFDVLANNAAVPCPFTFYTDKNTVARFHIDTPASLGQCLGGMDGSVLDVYHGEYEFDNFTIKFWNHRGQDNGVTLRYGKNITDIQQEESIDATITGICPFYADSDGNVVVLSEKVVEAENAAKYGFKRIVVVDMTEYFATQPTEADLRAEAQAYISSNNIGVPKVSISLKFENLADYEEYKDVALLEQVRLGDTVHVFFEPLDITAEARIVSTTFDVLNDKYKKVDVGSVKANMTNVVSSVVTEAQEAAEINTSSLEASFAHAIELLSGADGGNIVIRTNPVTGKPYEILIMDTDDMSTAVKVLRLNMNGLGLSTNGINGNYTAAITADGIVATAITTGILNAVRIQAGILQSQENANDPNFYLNLDSGVLKGKFSELTITGQTVNQIANGVLQNFIDGQYAQDIADLQDEIDGQIETYFDNYVPTLNNAPANTWATTSDKDNHLGDLFYVIDDPDHGGECYRWVNDNGTYKWQLVEDSAVATALAEALAAQALAGEKARVFVTTPVPPYDVGDLWLNANAGGDILRCQTAKTAEQSYAASDWVKASGYVTDSSLTQYDVLRRLTNEFTDNGIYLQNGQLYINATYIKSGTLDGIRVEAEEGLIGGWTIDSTHIMKERTVDGYTYRASLYAPATVSNLANAAFYVGKQNTSTEEWEYPIRLQYDGKLVATNAEITGKVTASSGNIAGWSLTSTDLSKEVTVSGDTYTLVMRAGDPNNGSLALFTRKNHGGTITYPFSVSYTGQLKATGADISGTIAAESGSIGGWEITNTQLRKIVTLDGVQHRLGLQATDDANINSGAFFVAKANGNSWDYPFMVRYSGEMSATNATITGRILANSGIIGNSATNKITIGTNGTNASIYNGMTSLEDTTHNGFYLGTDGLAIGKGKFKVTNAGALTATDATITGAITATTGSIGGWTVENVRFYKEATIDGTAYRVGFYAPASPGTGNRAIYVRVGSNTYPFEVYYDGSFTATKATIKGAITAESGVIGDKATNKITIGQATDYAAIYNGMTSLADTTHNGFYLGADGIALGKGKFKVTAAGALTATSATITGKITSSDATITGGTVQITTASSTNDSISLTYSNWTTALQPLQVVVWNKSTKRRAVLQAGGIFFAKDSNSINDGGTALSTLQGGGLTLIDDNAVIRATLQGSGLYMYDDGGNNRVILTGSGMYLKDDDLITKTFIGASNRNGVVYLYDSAGNIRVNLNDGGLYFSGAASGMNYTHYGQHAIDFMPPPSSVSSTAYNTGGWIDFHYQRNTSDYTSRLIGASNTTTALPSITNGSDRRMKEQIKPLDDVKYTEVLKELEPVEYKYKKFAGKHYGFIAQDVMEVCTKLGVDYSGLIEKSMVYAPEDDTEYYMLNYIDLIALLVKGYQELSAQICALSADK